MKRVISTIGILAVSLLLLAAPAYAASIQVDTDPAVITAVGNVNLKFTVMNDSSYTMRDMRIRGYNISDSDNSLGGRELYPGEGITFNTPNVPVTQEMLGTSIVYTFSWSEGGATKSQEIPVRLGDATAPPAGADMTGSVALSKASGKAGDKITITYTLKNPGTAPMTDVTIKDTLAGSTVIKSGATIEANGSTTATYEHTLGSQDAVSEATVTYKLNGESKTLKLEKQTIAVVNLKLSVNVSMADPTPEGVLFTIVLKNDGNQILSGISVKDDQGASVNAEALTLQAGQETLLTHTVRAEGTRVVSFTITGKDEAGQPYEDKTGSYNVLPYIDPSTISFQLFTHVVENLDETGRMKIRFTIQNNSTVQLTDASVSESQLGVVLQPIPVLAQGETVNEVDLIIGSPRELEFVAIAKDPSGVEHSYSSSVTASLVELATPSPAPEATPEVATNTRGGMSSTLVTVLIVLAVLMAIAGIALLVLSIYERKRNAQMDALDAEEYVRNTRVNTPAPEQQEPPAKVKRRERKQKKHEDPFDDDDDDLLGDTKPQNAVAQRTAPPQQQRAPESPAQRTQPQAPPKAQSRQPKPMEQGQGGGFRNAPIQPPPEPRPAIKPEPISRMEQPLVAASTVPAEPRRAPQFPPVQTPPEPRPVSPAAVPQFAESPKYPDPAAAFTAAGPKTEILQPPERIEPVVLPEQIQPELFKPVVIEPEKPVELPVPPVPQEPPAPVRLQPVQAPVVTPAPQQEAPAPQRPQAAGGVRNRIHRVRPVDVDKDPK